ncbi:MAG TPA: M48 family metalloprotease [Steroidobacteraceae bacterium]|jgi:Zn-dependent protease with chaperone function/Tfp pilus assembly major pilin PilA|nr:M48 family metalloprotease [Steroidobacteraceae bacterium]
MNAVTAPVFAPEDLVYPRERVLGAITLVLGVLLWIVLIVGTFGVALLMLGFGALLYLFAHSALIAHLKGNGVEISEAQFPDLHAQLVECCRRLGMDQPPKAYILNGNGLVNAFATKFLRTQYVVLTSDVVDAMHGNGEGLRFYMGHELGHLRMKHISKQVLRWPVLWLPLLGAAYSRARESTCDRHGLACCDSGEAAVRALGVLSAGGLRARSLNLPGYVRQTEASRGFWMSFHELISGYPWLTKRAARVMGDGVQAPSRNPFAYLLALFVPYGGRLGGGFAFLIMVYIVVVLAAIAIPAYQDYVARAALVGVVSESGAAREKLADYYLTNHKIPESLEAAGVDEQLADGSALTLDTQRMALTVQTARGELVFVPSDDHGRIVWTCVNGEGLKPAHLPASCRAGASR